MKAHIGVDADSGLVHSVITTAANVNDVTQANALLHGQEVEAYGDSGYQGAYKRGDARSAVRWHVAMRPGNRPFRVIKQQFGFAKVRYKGLTKNTEQIVTLFALANLWVARKKLLALQA